MYEKLHCNHRQLELLPMNVKFFGVETAKNFLGHYPSEPQCFDDYIASTEDDGADGGQTVMAIFCPHADVESRENFLRLNDFFKYCSLSDNQYRRICIKDTYLNGYI